ncbi:DNA repair protein XRCC4 isoform X2 [Pristis pectinata]|uniref:DNA repair protein XRCC4 isoform X2 n=1 Tax=Pristis pectinata TaxID=685728 RepID=UPI00223D517C|nr:DNA repair protein XRCC4 isoform X2 [Pristis pectinata]
MDSLWGYFVNKHLIVDSKASKAMEMHICRIWPLTTPDIVHYLKISWDEDLGNGFTITLCNGEQAWSGSVSSDQITIEANEAEMDREKYVEDLRCALITWEEKAKRYSFDFIKDSEREVFHFSYEKVSKDISFKLGSVELQEVSDTTEVIKEIINYVLHCNTELRSRNDHLQQENKRLLCERNSSLEELEKYVKAKEDLEQDLYSRFILVLNEKKAKIRQMQERLKCAHEQAEARSQNRSAVATSQETLLTEEDFDCNTDEERSGRTSESTSLAQPSKSATGDPIDSGLHDTVGIAPSRKRRYRHPQQKVEVAEPPEALQEKRSCPVSAASSVSNKPDEEEESLSTLPNTVEPDNLFDNI